MEFEWDEGKRKANIAKHGIDFVRVKTIWQNKSILDPFSENQRNGEPRTIAIGTMEKSGSEKIIAVVYTHRNGRRRIISARPARNYEREAYYDAFGRSDQG